MTPVRCARIIRIFWTWSSSTSSRASFLCHYECLLLAVATKSKFRSLVSTELTVCYTHIAKSWFPESWTCLHCASAPLGLREKDDTPRGPPQVVLIYSWFPLACETMRYYVIRFAYLDALNLIYIQNDFFSNITT